MKYYVEMSCGGRYPCTEWVYNLFVGLYDYMHIIREENVTVIKARVVH